MPLDLAAFLPFAFAVIGTPGPANVVLMTAGAAFGARRVLPFMFGVIFGKQFIIWPIGFGLMSLAATSPLLFAALKWASVAYLMWLAWKVAGMRLARGEAAGPPPGFLPGLIVHPLNPKAWALITGAFASFVSPGAGAFEATLWVAVAVIGVQFVCQPLYTFAGDRIAKAFAGTKAERWIMWGLAAASVLSVLYVVIKGG